MFEISLVNFLDASDAAGWNLLAGSNPTTKYEFIQALHDTGCASPKTGWTPHFLVLREDARLVGGMLLYLKSHSRGEYVFDHGWAEAFHRHGMRYYPKLLSSIPFTPVTGARLLGQTPAHRETLARAAIQVAKEMDVSSLHVLYPDDASKAALVEAGYLIREGVQFHWSNQGFESVDDFLGSLKHEKRKKLRQDSRRVAEAGVTFEHLRGAHISTDVLRFFYECYARTYEAHFSSPYLTFQFFERILRDAPDDMLIVLASKDGRPIATALNLVGGDTVYGRYWGSTEFVSGLHFETCYFQSIKYCIDHGFQRFEGGAQGEHKMARGLTPIKTWSAHWIANQSFADAIADFLDRETVAIECYADSLESRSPFKQDDPA
ncbi:N-acetyltransferase [Duganella sp. LX20W]|uniref:N-acetyltransferase n=1 Tax=Rugamonas brunnea TaxID=2758569 RepID=A0A7W2IAB4_9BURK|nr:GNAT family N-acetyltransferase [Rugamonas brunnea]MBA5635940.1 N-acetyltransferase [Rugamonas brunnea]